MVSMPTPRSTTGSPRAEISSVNGLPTGQSITGISPTTVYDGRRPCATLDADASRSDPVGPPRFRPTVCCASKAVVSSSARRDDLGSHHTTNVHGKSRRAQGDTRNSRPKLRQRPDLIEPSTKAPPMRTTKAPIAMYLLSASCCFESSSGDARDRLARSKKDLE